jgi:hypothetical protein
VRTMLRTTTIRGEKGRIRLGLDRIGRVGGGSGSGVVLLDSEAQAEATSRLLDAETLRSRRIAEAD